MSVTSRGAPRSGNGAAATPTSYATLWPETSPGSGTQITINANDIGVILGHIGATSISMTLPAGWNAVSGITNPTAQSTNQRTYAWWKRLTASEAAPTITNSGNATGGWENHVFAGANLGATPVRGLVEGTAAVTSRNLPSLTGCTANSMLLAGAAARVASGTIPTGITPHANYTEKTDHATSRSTAGQNIRMETAERAIATSGTFGGEAFTTTISSSMATWLIEILEEPTATDLLDDARHPTIILLSTPVTSGFTKADDSRLITPIAAGQLTVVSSIGLGAEARMATPIGGTTPAASSVGMRAEIRATPPLPGTTSIRTGPGQADSARSTPPLVGGTAIQSGFGLSDAVRSVAPVGGVFRATSGVGLGADLRHASPLVATASVTSSLISVLADDVRHSTAILGVQKALSALGLAATGRSASLIAPGPTSITSGLGRAADLRSIAPLLGVGSVQSRYDLVAEVRSLTPLPGTIPLDSGLIFSLADAARSLGVLVGLGLVDSAFNVVTDIPIPPDALIIDIAPFAFQAGDGGVIVVDLAQPGISTTRLADLVAEIGGGGA